jgi:transcriptional regulator with XRE-family HTH domain
MPRLKTPDPYAERIGARIRRLREAAGLTLEGLANEADMAKGTLSTLEHGRIRPTVHTLRRVAVALDVQPFDLLVFPEDGDREFIVDRTRTVSEGTLRALRREFDGI